MTTAIACRCPVASTQERPKGTTQKVEVDLRQLLYNEIIIKPVQKYANSFVVTLERFFQNQHSSVTLLHIQFFLEHWSAEGVIPAQSKMSDSLYLTNKVGKFRGYLEVLVSLGGVERKVNIKDFVGITKNNRKIRWVSPKPSMKEILRAAEELFVEN